MNDPKNFDAPPETALAGNNDLAEQYAALRRLFILSLVGLLLLAVSFNYLIFRQLVYTRKDLDVVRPQVTQLVEGYTKNEEPQIRSFINNLIGFAKAYPDFAPVLAKYKIVADTRPAAAAGPAPTAAPQAAPTQAPAATPPAKKK